MKNRKLILLAALMVSACAAQQPMAWRSESKDPSKFAADKWACLHDASAVAPPSAGVNTDPFFGNVYSYDVNADSRDNLFSACMNARSWHMAPLRAGEVIQ